MSLNGWIDLGWLNNIAFLPFTFLSLRLRGGCAQRRGAGRGGVQRPGMDTPLDDARSAVQSWLGQLEY